MRSSRRIFDMALTNKVAVVIGATGQLGGAIAKAFAHEGAVLVLVSGHEESLDGLQKELGFATTWCYDVRRQCAR